jgi:uncharacterized protein YceK
MVRRFISTVVSAAILAVTVAAAVVFALTGCGTLSNLQEKPSMFFPRNADVPPNRIYGGVRISAEEGWKDLTDGGGVVWGGYRWLGDVPLSAVGDTLTLPVTVRAALAREAARRQALQQPETLPEGCEPAGGKSGTDHAEQMRKQNP